MLANHINRCRHLALCLAVRARGRALGPRLMHLHEDIAGTTDAILKFIHCERANMRILFEGLLSSLEDPGEGVPTLDGDTLRAKLIDAHSSD